jgi:hypothetical protein
MKFSSHENLAVSCHIQLFTHLVLVDLVSFGLIINERNSLSVHNHKQNADLASSKIEYSLI